MTYSLGTTSPSLGESASSSLVTASPKSMAPPADILSDNSLIFFPSESEEKPRRSMPSQPKKVIFPSTDIRYRDTEEECSGVQKVEVKHEKHKVEVKYKNEVS